MLQSPGPLKLAPGVRHSSSSRRVIAYFNCSSEDPLNILLSKEGIRYLKSP